MPDLLRNLNDQQKEAVTLPIGPCLIWAGPGSGKTRVLTHRLAYLVHGLDVPPGSILAVTFTNKAANEMKERVQALLGHEAGRSGQNEGQDRARLAVGTFHAICARILRDETERTPYQANWIILDAEDQNALLESVLTDEGGNLSMAPKAFELRTTISRWKNGCLEPDAVQRTDANRNDLHLYRAYQQRLLTYNAMDFDDLLMQTQRLFQQHDAVRAKYQQRWPHVLVDEFQDTNQIQYEILKQLALHPASRQHLYAVGDEDQSIYGFRGAQYENLRRFTRDFRQPRTVYLERNYRSTPQILAVANGLIGRNTQREAKVLHSGRAQGPRPVLRDADNEYNEADWISRAARQLLEQTAYRPEDLTIMYRTNAQSGPIEEALIRQRVPYRVVGARKFYERMEVKDALAYLRLIANPQDFLSLTRILNRPARGLSADVPQRLHACSLQWQLPLGETLAAACRGAETTAQPRFSSALTGNDLRALRRFQDRLQQWRDALERRKEYTDPGRFLAHVCESAGYFAFLSAEFEDGSDRAENVRQLIAIASQRHSESGAHVSGRDALDAFLVHASLIASQDELEEQPDRVDLMTLHTAKGLEFPVVFIAGLEENSLPFFYSVQAGTRRAIEEERRLLYVGVTRAQELLLLSWARERRRYSRSESRFLTEIPAEALRQAEDPSWRSENGRTPLSSLILNGL